MSASPMTGHGGAALTVLSYIAVCHDDPEFLRVSPDTLHTYRALTAFDTGHTSAQVILAAVAATDSAPMEDLLDLAPSELLVRALRDRLPRSCTLRDDLLRMEPVPVGRTNTAEFDGHWLWRGFSRGVIRYAMATQLRDNEVRQWFEGTRPSREIARTGTEETAFWSKLVGLVCLIDAGVGATQLDLVYEELVADDTL